MRGRRAGSAITETVAMDYTVEKTGRAHATSSSSTHNRHARGGEEVGSRRSPLGELCSLRVYRLKRRERGDEDLVEDKEAPLAPLDLGEDALRLGRAPPATRQHRISRHEEARSWDLHANEWDWRGRHGQSGRARNALGAMRDGLGAVVNPLFSSTPVWCPPSPSLFQAAAAHARMLALRKCAARLMCAEPKVPCAPSAAQLYRGNWM